MNAVALDPHISLRPMRDHDVDSVLGCERAAYEFPWSADIFSDCLRVGYNCWVVEIGRLVVGHGIMSVGAGECHVLESLRAPALAGDGPGAAPASPTAGTGP